MILIQILFIITAAFLFLIAPNVLHPKRDFKSLTGRLYAHRGLHDALIPENSLPAFEKAAEKGYGIELDVHMTKDDRLIVFHDSDLRRICGQSGTVEEKTLEELSACRLAGTDNRIPTFDEAMTLIAGRVPVIIELKSLSRDKKIAMAVNDYLVNYQGVYCVESFNPFLINWYRRNRPDVVRGQLSGALYAGKDGPAEEKVLLFLLRNLLVDCISRPDFIAYGYEGEKNFCCRAVRKLFRPLWATWTVKTPESEKSLKKRYDILIFEGYEPDQAQV